MPIRSSLSIKRLDKADITTPISTKVTRLRLTKKPSKAVPITVTSSVKNESARKSTPKHKKTTSKRAHTPAKQTPKTKRASTRSPGKKPTRKKTPAIKKQLPKKLALAPTMTPPIKNSPIDTPKRHPLGHLLLEKKLRAAGFRGGISTDKRFLDAYAMDESIFSIRPQIVLQPKTVTDIEVAVQLVAAETKQFTSLSLTPRGAGTGLTGGSLTDSIVIDTSAHLTSILDVAHHKDDVHITCEPGVRWRDMEERLKRIGYHAPLHLTSRDMCTVGGAVGNNAAGSETSTYRHATDLIVRLEFIAFDGTRHTITPLTYKQFRTLTKEKNTYTTLLSHVLDLIEENEKEIKKAEPRTANNTSGYPLWAVCPDGIAKWKKGTGTFSLIPLIAGSQGSLGIISSITLRAIPRVRHATLLAVPIFSLEDAHTVITKAYAYSPLAMEIFDDVTFDLALQNPDFFKKYHTGLPYYRSLLSLYTTYHVRYGKKSPVITLLITLSDETTRTYSARQIAESISVPNGKARVISLPHEETMLLHVARSSYALLKLRGDGKRPAAFLEDMFIPHRHIPKFLTQVRKLFKEFNVTVTMYGHAGKGHFQFYPLIDFKQKTTPALIEKLSAQYLTLAEKHDGIVCSELND